MLTTVRRLKKQQGESSGAPRLGTHERSRARHFDAAPCRPYYICTSQTACTIHPPASGRRRGGPAAIHLEAAQSGASAAMSGRGWRGGRAEGRGGGRGDGRGGWPPSGGGGRGGGRLRPGQRPVAETMRLTIAEQLELFQRSDEQGEQCCVEPDCWGTCACFTLKAPLLPAAPPSLPLLSHLF